MKILTNAQYNAICDIVSDLQKENEDLKKQVHILKDILHNTSDFKNFLNLDFPNSQKGGGHDIGNIDINDILNN